MTQENTNNITLEKEFNVYKFKHMTSIVGTYYAQQLINEVQSGTNIPLFMVEDIINKKVDKKLLETTLAGQLPAVYSVAWESMQSMFN